MKTKQLGFESLEGRQMMAGDVSVVVSGNDLVVTGDDSSEAVAIVLKSNGIKVKGLDGSTVNGSGKQFFDNVHGAIRVDLGGGDNALLVRNVDVSLLHVATLGGNDAIGLVNVRAGRLDISTGDGDDAIGIGGSRIQSDATINSGNSNTSSSGPGFGDDAVGITGSSIGGDLRIKTGNGNDAVALGNVDLIATAFAELYGGSIHQGGVSIGGLTQIETFSGADTVFATEVDFRRFTSIETSSGTDFIKLKNVHAQQTFRIDAGDQQDKAKIKNSQFDSVARFDGGSDYDLLVVKSNRIDIRSFTNWDETQNS